MVEILSVDGMVKAALETPLCDSLPLLRGTAVDVDMLFGFEQHVSG
jgi:hypothetical protein